MDKSLIERAENLDPNALSELYERYAPRMYAYLYRRVSDPALAEDLTGEVFVRVLQALAAGHAWHSSFQAWLYRIAHNLVVDHYRGRLPAPPVPVDEALIAGVGQDPVQEVEDRLDGVHIGAALRQLTPEQQQVLALRFGEELQSRQVAEVMGKTVGAVEGLQHRALASLRRILMKEGRV